MSITTFSTPHKNLIRTHWNKEIIKFISENLTSKLVYLGLPSPSADDVLEWIDYINEVIAFQCREYPHPSDPTQSRDEIDKLENKLEELERQKKIDTFSVYDGYMEEVLLNRIDNSSNEFIQNDVIHLYNLDFCNTIQYPRDVLDKNGDLKKVHKFDAIKELLEFQYKIDSDTKKFVLFLTINASFNGQDLQNYIAKHKTNYIDTYLKSLNSGSLQTPDRKVRYLRTFILESLNKIFVENKFKIDILPTLLYKGISDRNMMHFTFLGTKITEEVEDNGIKDFLSKKILTFEDTSIINQTFSGFEEEDNKTCPIDCFKDTDTFNQYWNS